MDYLSLYIFLSHLELYTICTYCTIYKIQENKGLNKFRAFPCYVFSKKGEQKWKSWVWKNVYCAKLLSVWLAVSGKNFLHINFCPTPAGEKVFNLEISARGGFSPFSCSTHCETTRELLPYSSWTNFDIVNEVFFTNRQSRFFREIVADFNIAALSDKMEFVKNVLFKRSKNLGSKIISDSTYLTHTAS